MSNKDERCQRCCGYDAERRECKAYKPWGLHYMEQDDCTFYNFHESRRLKKCTGCRFFMFARTIGSPDVPEWTCRFGFTPSKDCVEMGEYNVRARREYYRKHPEDLQLTLNF